MATEEQLKAAARRAIEAGNMQAANELIAAARQAGGLAPLGSDAQMRSAAQQTQMDDLAEDVKNVDIGQNTAMDTAPGLRFNQPGRGETAVMSAANGLTAGFMDNIAAGAATALGQNSQGDLFDYSAPMGQRYNQALDTARLNLDTARANHPKTAIASEITGALGTGLAALPRTAGTNLATTTGRTTGIGALEGALFGAGNSDGENVLEQTAGGAALGGAVGGIARPVIQGARGLGRSIANPFMGALGRGDQSRAASVVNRAMGRAGLTADDVTTRLDATRNAGAIEYTLADLLGQPGQGVVSGVARSPGAGARELTEFLSQRQLGAPDRTSAAVADALGATDTAAQRTATLASQRSNDAAVNYGAATADAGPVNLNGAIDTIDSTLRRNPILGDTALADGPLGRRLMALRDQMTRGGEQLIDFDAVKALRTDLRRAMDRNSDMAADLRPVYNQLDEALEESSDGYRLANDTYARQSGEIDAVDRGVAAARSTSRGDDVVQEFGAMPQGQQSAFQAGLGDRLLGRIENSGDATDVTKTLRTPRMTQILDSVSNDPAALRGAISREKEMFDTFRAGTQGSRTANNAADMADVNNVDFGLIANALNGNYGAAGSQLARTAGNAMTGQTEATRQLIGRMMMSNNPAEILAPVVKQANSREARQQALEAAARVVSNTNVGSDTKRQIAQLFMPSP